MGYIGWVLLALTGVLVSALLLLVIPLRLRVQWGESEKSFSIRYLALSVEFDCVRKCRRIRLLDWIIAVNPWPVTSEAARRPGRGELPDSSRVGDVGGMRRFLARVNLLWGFRVTLRRATLVILRFLGRVVRVWHVERADVRMVVGFGDPARTGMATGWFYSIWSILRPQFRHARVDWCPCFERQVLRVHADIILRVLPVQLVYHATAALAMLPWRGLWKLRSSMRSEEDVCRIT
jgi:hypothetical protein